MKSLHSKFEETHSKLITSEQEKRHIELKHEIKCVELKNLKSERDDLTKEYNKTNVALKSTKK